MRILHTADWHAGRALHGVDRTDEVRAALAQVADVARREDVDLIAVAGDLFDSKNPSAAAEDAVYGFFLETGRAGIPSVVIAGNHDSPSRLDAVARVLRLTNVHAVGNPRVAGEGGAFELEAGGERAVVAALPFVSERRLVRVPQLATADLGEQREHYRRGMRLLIDNLAGAFRPDAVNLVLLHTTMEGATLAHSEYAFHCTSSYTLPAEALPPAASYVALGHIHKPQGVQGVPDHAARYPGSLIQLDFGEHGDRKHVLIVEARPGRATRVVAEVPVTAGRPLHRVALGEEELDRRSAELAALPGWLKLVVRLATPRPGLKERLQSTFPNLVAVEQELPEGSAGDETGVDLERLTLEDAYARYVDEQRGEEGAEVMVGAFRALHEEVLEAEERAAAGEPAGDGRGATGEGAASEAAAEELTPGGPSGAVGDGTARGRASEPVAEDPVGDDPVSGGASEPAGVPDEAAGEPEGRP